MDLVAPESKPQRAGRVADAGAILLLAVALGTDALVRHLRPGLPPAPVDSEGRRLVTSQAPALPPSQPSLLLIPAIAVYSALVCLGLQAVQSLEVANDFDLAGCYLE